VPAHFLVLPTRCLPCLLIYACCACCAADDELDEAELHGFNSAALVRGLLLCGGSAVHGALWWGMQGLQPGSDPVWGCLLKDGE
jgi:hypothetical protein